MNMIDFADAEFPLPPMSKLQRRRIPGYAWRKRLVGRQHLKATLPNGYSFKAIVVEGSIRLRFCPSKVLGEWNSIGSTDLRQLVKECVPVLLKALRIPLDDELRACLADGSYRLRELHIAESFRLAGYDQDDFVRKLFRQINESQFPEMMRRGVGFYVYKNRRRLEWAIYSKATEFANRGEPFYAEKMKNTRPGWSRAAVGLERERQRLAANAGPRFELKLKDHFLRLDRSKGSWWTSRRVESIYKRELEQLRLPEIVDPVQARKLLGGLSGGARASFLLWLHGETLKSDMDRSTLRRHAAAVREVFGDVDITQPSIQYLKEQVGVAVADVVTWKNRVTLEDIALPGGPLE